MVGETLYGGFASANRHLSLFLADILWKGLWLVITLVMAGLLLIWVATDIGSLQISVASLRNSNPLLLLSAFRQLLSVYGTEWFSGVVLLCAGSVAAWMLLEAYFRSRWDASIGHKEDTFGNFWVHLASGIARLVVLISAAVLIGILVFAEYWSSPIGQWSGLWEDTRGVALIGVVILASVGFALTITDTLIRGNCMELFGTHMLEIAGVIGTLLLVEANVVVAAVMTVLAAASHIATPWGLAGTILLAIAAGSILTALHSYLLLVRFFSIGIMKRDVAI